MRGAAAIRFAAAADLRPAAWATLERRDVDKARRTVNVRGTDSSLAPRGSLDGGGLDGARDAAAAA